jgi:hypothetical protein
MRAHDLSRAARATGWTPYAQCIGAPKARLTRVMLAVVLAGATAHSAFTTHEASAQAAATISEAAQATPQPSDPSAIGEPAEHHLSQKAVEIARPFGFPITNSMVVTWIVALGLILLARVATRNMVRTGFVEIAGVTRPGRPQSPAIPS